MKKSIAPSALAFLKKALNDPKAEFRDGQIDAIKAIVVDKQKLLVVQRTGWGKSIVYFIATRLLRDAGKGPTLLVSPLLSLMRNQINMASRIGIEARTINSDNRESWEKIKGELVADKVDLLLISPERLANEEFQDEMLKPVIDTVGLFVVDEAHCISDWGHEFRPDYRRITRILQALPANIPVLATTATANDRVVRDCLDQLGPSLKDVRGPLNRDSLALQNINLGSATARMAWLADHLPELPGSGIIYVLTIRDAERLAGWLRHRGIKAEVYHAKLEKKGHREKLENELLNNSVKALVATTALSMGFDKPDLGFVIHYQRPGSVVHYYQQVGRAGRAINKAYGVLLSGHEDDAITDYFIRSAFPLDQHTSMVLKALERSPQGISQKGLYRLVNLPATRIDGILKYLAVLEKSPVTIQEKKWFRTVNIYKPETEKIQRLTELRRREQQRMRDYRDSKECLMAFLQRELDDRNVRPCGICANCTGTEPVPFGYDPRTEEAAKGFMKANHPRIKPRKQWIGDSLAEHGWTGQWIPDGLQACEGMALCLWGDEQWGGLVKKGKQQDGVFSQDLVTAMADMIKNRWRAQPPPVWVACVPSLTNPGLVPDFAKSLAKQLKLPFHACITKVRQTRPQKEMANSYHQARNLQGAFKVDAAKVKKGPVLLVDDMVDSGWTFTVITALLREAGSGPVYPAALAVTTTRTE